jgi:hypothetical protein
MSIRVKFGALYGLLFSLMTLLLSYNVKNEEITRRPMEHVGEIVTVSAIISAIVLLILVLSWKDIPHKRIIQEEVGLGYLLALAMMIISTLTALYVIWHIQRPAVIAANNTTTGIASYRPPQAHGVSNFTNSTPTVSIPPTYLLYGSFVLFVVGAAYFVTVYYRDALKKRERKEMRSRAELFDRKVEELGLDMFSDPREAVVGIYKNTVLWLEVLGLPYRESWTHWEHVRNVTVFRESFIGLTRLFEKAKYAPEKVTWEDAERALELYRRMRRALNEGE